MPSLLKSLWKPFVGGGRAAREEGERRERGEVVGRVPGKTLYNPAPLPPGGHTASAGTASPSRDEESREKVEGGQWRLLEGKMPRSRRLTLDDCLLLVIACSQELEQRGLLTSGVMRPFRQDSEPALMVHLIELFSIDKNARSVPPTATSKRTSGGGGGNSPLARSLSAYSKGTINPAFFGALSDARPQTIAALLRWALRHLKVPRRLQPPLDSPGSPSSSRTKAGTGMRWYNAFVSAEAARRYPKTAYSDLFLPSIPTANGDLITCLLNLATVLSAEDVNVGVRCVRSWAFWVFGAQAKDFVPTGTLEDLGWADGPTRDGFWDEVGVQGILMEYHRVAGAMERLWIAYIRDVGARQPSSVPRALRERTTGLYPLHDRTLARRIKVLWVRTRSEVDDVHDDEDEDSSQVSDSDHYQRRSPAQTMDNALRASAFIDTALDERTVQAQRYLEELMNQRDLLAQADVLPSLEKGLFTKESARVTQILAHRDNSKLPKVEQSVPSSTTPVNARSTMDDDRHSRWSSPRPQTAASQYRTEASPRPQTTASQRPEPAPRPQTAASQHRPETLRSHMSQGRHSRVRSETPSGAPIADIFTRMSTSGFLDEDDDRLGARPGTAVRALSPATYRPESRLSNFGPAHRNLSNDRSFSRQSFIPLIEPFSNAYSPRLDSDSPLDVDKFLTEGFGDKTVESALELKTEATSPDPYAYHGPRYGYEDDGASQVTNLRPDDKTLPGTPVSTQRAVESLTPVKRIGGAPTVILSVQIETVDVAFIDFWLDSAQDDVCSWGNVGMLQLRKHVVEQLIENVGGNAVDWLLVEEICIPKGISPTPTRPQAELRPDLYAESEADHVQQPSFLGNITKKASSFFETPRKLETTLSDPPASESGLASQSSQLPVAMGPPATRATPLTRVASKNGGTATAAPASRSISMLGLGSTLASWWSGPDIQPTTAASSAAAPRPVTPPRSGDFAPDPPTPGPLQTPERRSVPVKSARSPVRRGTMESLRSGADRAIVPPKSPPRGPMSPTHRKSASKSGAMARPQSSSSPTTSIAREPTLTHMPSLHTHKVSGLNATSRRGPIDIDPDHDEEFPMRPSSRLSLLGTREKLGGSSTAPRKKEGLTYRSPNGLLAVEENAPMLLPRSSSRLGSVTKKFGFRRNKGKGGRLKENGVLVADSASSISMTRSRSAGSGNSSD